jgi:large conductance mechanosensitive channel
MGIVREFRDFIVKGNAIDLAVGIIIGAAFGAMVNSLVKDVIMPPIGVLMGGVDFSQLAVELQAKKMPGEKLVNGMTATREMPAVYLSYGNFINAVIALLIQGFAIFLVVKMINTARKRFEREKEAVPPPAAPEDVLLLREIRDSLRGRGQSSV